MFIVLFRVTDPRERTAEETAEHVTWVKRGIADGVFLLAGSLKPGPGGAILAHDISEEALRARVAEDPFVAQGLVSVETIEMKPAMFDERVGFLAQG